jgi:hypothetical protein
MLREFSVQIEVLAHPEPVSMSAAFEQQAALPVLTGGAA